MMIEHKHGFVAFELTVNLFLHIFNTFINRFSIMELGIKGHVIMTISNNCRGYAYLKREKICMCGHRIV